MANSWCSHNKLKVCLLTVKLVWMCLNELDWKWRGGVGMRQGKHWEPAASMNEGDRLLHLQGRMTRENTGAVDITASTLGPKPKHDFKLVLYQDVNMKKPKQQNILWSSAVITHHWTQTVDVCPNNRRFSFKDKPWKSPALNWNEPLTKDNMKKKLKS